MYDPDNANAKQFADLLESYDLKQHVNCGTHASGHTLDLVITRSDDSLIKDTKVKDPVISDHLAIHCVLSIQKPQFRKKLINFRKLHSLNMDSFCKDIMASPLLQDQATDLDTMVDQYDRVLRQLLDQHAPKKKRQVTVRPSAPWYTSDVVAEKRKRRRLERRWRASRLQCDRDQYVRQCCVVNNLIATLKSAHYTSIINEHSSDQRILFATVNKLLQKPSEKRYPPSVDNTSLANSFADFFINKIDKIHSKLVQRNIIVGPIRPIPSTCPVEFSDFREVSQEEVKVFACKPSSKSCVLDPLPAMVLKGCFSVLLPTITKFVNLSLSTGRMPNALTVAALSPSLKKPDADFKQFSNFRPISNLTLISKIIEKAVAEQLTDHVKTYHLDVMYQSAFKVLHSTETALLKVQNDILRAVDDNKSVILLLLDLSAAFDTVDHLILLSRLSHRFGIKGNALAWFDSYLKSRKQFVQIEDCRSSQRCLAHGVPQGSVLGPLLYLLYTSPIADIINLHSLQYHLYADDSQLYISFKTDCFADLAQAKSSVELCVKDIDWWMTTNMLKLNQEKTELIVISSKFRPKPTISYVSVGDEQILPKSSARNLGVIFDECCNMVEHVNKICKTSYYHLRNISKIRKYLTEETTEILFHAFVSSKLDYCNSLLYGLPKHMISSLQSVQNTAARIVTLTKKFDHITPVLIQLHWLPVHFRILFKVLLLVYKALNSMAPLYITELLSYRTCSRMLRSTDQKLLAVPKSRRKTYGDRAFSVAAPKLWIELPLDLRSLDTINLFKKHLKTDLFKKAYNV